MALTNLEENADVEIYCGDRWLHRVRSGDPNPLKLNTYDSWILVLEEGDEGVSRSSNLYWDTRHHVNVELEHNTCADDSRLDAFHIIEENQRPMVILCERLFTGLMHENGLGDFLDRPIETGLSINEIRDNSLAAAFAREVLLIGIRYGGQTLKSYDEVEDRVKTRRFVLCHILALAESGDTTVTNADSIVLFGIGQCLTLPSSARVTICPLI